MVSTGTFPLDSFSSEDVFSSSLDEIKKLVSPYCNLVFVVVVVVVVVVMETFKYGVKGLGVQWNSHFKAGKTFQSANGIQTSVLSVTKVGRIKPKLIGVYTTLEVE